jgi:hypothetical protein
MQLQARTRCFRLMPLSDSNKTTHQLRDNRHLKEPLSRGFPVVAQEGDTKV